MKLTLSFGKNLRADCAWILYQVLENGKSTRELFPLVLERYSANNDRNWINETVLGVLRHLPTLQTWLRPRLQKPLKGSKKVIEHVLIVGLYQLKFMRVSEHAAINETVNACAALKAPALKGLVNAILRDAQRSELNISDDPLLASGLPKWLFTIISQNYPDNTERVIESMNNKAPIWLRVNTHIIDFEKYCELLRRANISFNTPESTPNALILSSASVTELPGFNEGFFTVQDGAAQQAAWLLKPENNDRILDCCSAPGGKACHTYSLAPRATITAVDNDQVRSTRIEENSKRLQCNLNILVGDAANPQTWWDGQQYDRILLDAPCSATGVIRRHPDIRWLRKASDIDVLVRLQAQILSAIWPLLKPGGTLLYATCSILPQENNNQVDQFLSLTPNASRDMSDIQILPGQQQMDGFYYARLIKSK